MSVLPVVDVPCSPVPRSSFAIKYCGPVFDPSGYAEFARGFVKSAHREGVPLCLEIVCYDKNQPALGSDRDLFVELQGRTLPYCVKVINTTADDFMRRQEPGCLNIGFTMFETSRIPAIWAQECNKMDGILVPCTWNREVFEQSGVRVPIRVVPPGIDPPASRSPVGATPPPAALLLTAKGPLDPSQEKPVDGESAEQTPWQTVDITDYRHAYKFYSIFQWTDRKNPAGLLRSYLAEFRKTDNVCLILKTYRQSFAAEERELLLKEIAAIRDAANLPDHAPVLLISDLLSQDQVFWLHQFGDCFVLPHRSEGVGMPHMAAMAHAKPVIATGFSGNMEFMSAENSILLPYQFRPVTGMRWSPWYESDMMWGEPDLAALRTAMRRCYADQAHAAKLGRRGAADVLGEFSWKKCAHRFVQAVREIVEIAQSQGAPTADSVAA